MKLNFDKMLTQTHINYVVYHSHGAWIDMLFYGWGKKLFNNKIKRDLTTEEKRECFLAILKKVLEQKRAFLMLPGALYHIEKTPHYAKFKTIIDKFGEEIDIWDIPIDDMIQYIREHIPDDPAREPYKDDPDKEEYWYSGYCPWIVWNKYDESIEKDMDIEAL